MCDVDKHKYRRNKSPSKRRMSSINKEDNNINLTPDEIDEIIEKWYDAKQLLKELEEKEAKYKNIITKIMELTDSDVIKGKDLHVVKRIQNRTFILKENMPSEVYDKYKTIKQIPCFYIKDNEK